MPAHTDSRTARKPRERAESVREQFRQRFRTVPRIYRAPGRVNLIGEHTDYNDGYVMPAAIDLSCWIAVAPRQDNKLLVYSDNFEESVELKLDDPYAHSHQHWSDYVLGTAIVLKSAGYEIRGADILISSDVPVGAGLSSSAALEVTTGFALLDSSGQPVNLQHLALACQRAENEFVGARCGIMDQFVACQGRPGSALMLDCRSLDFQVVPLPKDVRIVISNTMVKHAIASGEYNLRRRQCEDGLRLLSALLPEVSALRDVALEDLEKYRPEMPILIYQRCHHVITENQRVLAATSALEKHDLDELRQLMAESHRSLQHDFEVSCRELDLMVELANQIEGVWGARLTGGGFGGCTVNLVATAVVPQFQKHITKAYSQHTGVLPEIYEVTASKGVERCEPDS